MGEREELHWSPAVALPVSSEEAEGRARGEAEEDEEEERAANRGSTMDAGGACDTRFESETYENMIESIQAKID